MNRHTLKVLALLAGALAIATDARAEFLTNGDFEATPFDSGWLNTDPLLPTIVHRGLTPTGLDTAGKQAAYIVQGGAAATGGIQQWGLSSGSSWQLDLLFATEDPGGTDDRSMYVLLGHSGGVLNLNVVGGPGEGDNGSIRVYDSTLGYQNIGGSVSFSVDADGDNSFDDVGDTLNVHSMRIVGDYSTATPSYDVYLSAAGSSTLSLVASDLEHFQTTDPDAGEEITGMHFPSVSSTGDYVIDQVSLIPEPGTVVLLLSGLLAVVFVACSRRLRRRGV